MTLSFSGISEPTRRKRSKNNYLMTSLLMKNRLVGEKGGVGFKGTPRWF